MKNLFFTGRGKHHNEGQRDEQLARAQRGVCQSENRAQCREYRGENHVLGGTFGKKSWPRE